MDRKDHERLSLFTPGPVDISPEALEGLTAPFPHHRSSRFRDTIASLTSSLKAAFLTEGEVVTLTSSGTGSMEAAVANLFSPSEKVLVPVSGKFSRRWAGICESYGLDVLKLELAPGRAPEPDAVASALEAEPDICAALLTHCETSTGSLTDLEAVGGAIRDVERSAKRDVLIVADCITSLCVDELRVDDWAIDCAVAASQKGLLAPPGLAFVSLGPRALRRVRTSTASRYYFDLRRYLDGSPEPWQSDGAPFTPAIPLVNAALASLKRIQMLGLERVWEASRSGAGAIRLLVEAAGMKPVAERQASGVVAFSTGSLTAEEIAATLEKSHGIIIARGQAELKGEILRASPIGKSASELRRFAHAFAEVLAGMGQEVDLGMIEPELGRLLEACSIWE